MGTVTCVLYDANIARRLLQQVYAELTQIVSQGSENAGLSALTIIKNIGVTMNQIKEHSPTYFSTGWSSIGSRVRNWRTKAKQSNDGEQKSD